MRTTWIGLMLAFAAACDGGEDKDPSDEVPSDTDVSDTEPTDTEESEVEVEDADGDGFSTERGDCDDEDENIHPAATDICDEIDNDCDDLVDEFYDRDEDGYLDAEDCEHGDDCDDYDADVNPGEEEIPYDGEDQDCSGSDLIDVDGDGYTAEEVGGDDCDDEDTGIHPDAEDIAKDGIDQDCSGKDNNDGDGDGYDDEDYGGEDCDDDDPDVRPDRYDFWNDDEDVNCDNKDSRDMDLEDATVTLEGTAAAQEWMGWASASCDLDEDGYDELIVSAVLSASYMGQVGIFYGTDEPDWTTGMAMSDADTVIEGTTGAFGSTLLCDDFDGDGHADLMISQADVACGTTLTATGMAYFFYGDGTGTDALLEDADADATLDYNRVAALNGCVVIDTPAEAHDLDGDGAAEILFNFQSSSSLSDTTQGLYILPGGSTLSGDSDLEDEAWLLETSGNIYGLEPTEDQDGDGVADLIVGQPFWYDTADTGDTGEYYQGRIAVLSTPDDEADFDDQVLSWLRGSEIGNHVALGYSLGEVDLDGDGAAELVAGSPYHPTADEEDILAGGLYVFTGIDELGETPVDADGEAVARLVGEDDYGLMGQELWVVPDLNGDGVDEVLVWEENESSATGDDSGKLWLFDGAALADSATDTSYEDNTVLLAWDAEGSGYQTGHFVTVGDFDGDGMSDLVINAFRYGASSTPGKSYVYLSSTWL